MDSQQEISNERKPSNSNSGSSVPPISFKVSKEQKEELEARAADVGVDVSKYIRNVLFSTDTLILGKGESEIHHPKAFRSWKDYTKLYDLLRGFVKISRNLEKELSSITEQLKPGQVYKTEPMLEALKNLFSKFSVIEGETDRICIFFLSEIAEKREADWYMALKDEEEEKDLDEAEQDEEDDGDWLR